MLLIAAMTMVGCKKADTNNELKPFDVQQEFTDNAFTFFTGAKVIMSGDSANANAMTIGWGALGNYTGYECSQHMHDFFENFGAGIHTAYFGKVVGAWKR